MQTSLWADSKYTGAVMTPLHMPKSDWLPPKISELPDWLNHRVAVDVETRDGTLTKLGPGARRPDCYIVGISFSIEGVGGYYLPVRHQGGGNLDVEQVFNYMRHQAKYFTGILVGAKLPYDLDFLASEGVKFRPKFFRDVQLAEPLLDENQFKYNLDAIAERWNVPGKDESLLRLACAHAGLHPKKDLWKLHSKYVGAYAIQDVDLPLELLRKQEREIEKQGLWSVYDLESELMIASLKMTRRGVRIDQDKLEQVRLHCLREEEASVKQLSYLTGIKFDGSDITKPGALARALDKANIPYPLTAKTKKPSINKELLEAADHPICDAILEAKKFNKLRTTFVKGVINHMVKGRLHPEYHQMKMERDDGKLAGAGFGRMSSSNPNLQNQPSKGALGKMFRTIYLPDEGALWSCNDYSQQEPRLATHFGEMKGYAGAKELGDKFRNNPDTDCYKLIGELGKIERSPAKDLYLGRSYGKGGGAMCESLGLPTIMRQGRHGMYKAAGPEGQKIINQFDASVPFVKMLADRCQEMAEKRGYIVTLSGRRCRFTMDEDGSFQGAYKGLNRLIQGSAGDQLKMAIVAADKAGFPIQIPVHDELDLSVENRAYAEELATVMRECVTISVPSKVDVEIGPNWGEIE